MPLVRIDVTAGRSPKELQAISQAVHEAIVDEYRIPERDYFHILTEHPAGQLVAQDAGLGFERSDAVVMLQIFTQRGRSVEAKQSLYARIHEALGVSVSPVRTSSSATWKTAQKTGRSASGAPST